MTNSATNYEQEFIDCGLNYMVRHNMIKNHPNSKSDHYFVNTEIDPFAPNATFL